MLELVDNDLEKLAHHLQCKCSERGVAEPPAADGAQGHSVMSEAYPYTNHG
jgi:hypothetical protein